MKEKAMVVVSWDPKDPRGTITVDGYYFSTSLAKDVMGMEREEGRETLLAIVADGSAPHMIPGVLFPQC